MTGAEWLGLLLALLVMAVGVIGSVLPGVPSTPLILVAAVGHRLYFGPAGVSNAALVLLVVLTLLSLLLDYLATIFGARKLGATWKGIVGGLLGLIVGGILFNIPGILIGPFVGALLFELAGGREVRQAARAGVGAVLGMVIGTLGRIGCAIVMVGLFVYSVLMRAGVPAPLDLAALWMGLLSSRIPGFLDHG